jgi:hypothetical protein
MEHTSWTTTPEWESWLGVTSKMSAADFALSENDFTNFEESEYELTVRVQQITAARGHHDRVNPLQAIFTLTWNELGIDAQEVASVVGTATAMHLTGPVTLVKQIHDNHIIRFDCYVAPDFWLKVILRSQD